MSKNLKPHKAAILLTILVSDVLPTGESTNEPVPAETLAEYGINKNMVVMVNGFDLDNCLQKLKTKITEFGKE